MHLTFYKESLGFAALSWKRMLSGLSDTIATLVLGAFVLKVASVVLIISLTLNIALGSFSTLIMMHSDRAQNKARLLGVFVQAAIGVSVFMVVCGLVARVVFGPDIGGQSMWFLLLSVFRPLLVVWNVYCGEMLLRNGQQADVQQQTSRGVIVYTLTSWSVLGVVFSFDFEPSILWLLIGVYTTQLFTAFVFHRQTSREARINRSDISAVVVSALSNPFEVTGIKSAISNALTNVMELGFLAVAGWVVVARFDNIAIYYFPLFNMFEWGSGFAIGLSRVYTERLISKSNMPSYWHSIGLFFLYAVVFVALYSWIAARISPAFDKIGLALSIFAVLYVIFDGLQLILRSVMLAQSDGGRLLTISTLVYSSALVGLGVAYGTRSDILLFSALIVPLVSTVILLGREALVRSAPERA
jgi:hypothetical protein